MSKAIDRDTKFAGFAFEKGKKAGRRETLKVVLDIVNKHWAGYCDFEDKRACLEILENIHDEIYALTQSGEE